MEKHVLHQEMASYGAGRKNSRSSLLYYAILQGLHLPKLSRSTITRFKDENVTKGVVHCMGRRDAKPAYW